MPAGFDSVLQVFGAEAGRRAEQHDVDRVDDVFVRIEAGEHVFFFDFDSIPDAAQFFESADGGFRVIHERVGDGDQFRVRVSAEGIGGSSGTASATTDQADPQRVGAGRVGS